ncbi:WD repeat-containing protein 89 [Condylostylus longicornis]|uniref:WD repeat-containing protein 89 n=1 Tax=Condylostylus longicornis TaxID=2530218 RepID=UPI00244DDD03|nr:WD repeat-containing protein 89 [Condylostylus longicornis]
MAKRKAELFEETSSSGEEDPIVDEDICAKNDLETQFSSKYCISSEEAVSLKHVYVLSLTSNEQFNRIAAGMSNGQVHLFDIQTGSRLDRIHPITPSAKSSSICGLKFLNENTLLVGKTSGKIFLYDIRTNKKVQTFEEKNEDSPKPILCFDSNINERIICAGTEQVLRDSYILFFDIRQNDLLGAYWESHQDDITSVKFHPKQSDLLISGSTDGLINIFDISQKAEEDAIQMTLNTDSSVHRLNWHKNVYDKDIISCITHTNDLQLFQGDEGDLISSFDRSKITTAIKRNFEGDCYLVNCHSMEDDSIFILAGSIFNKGNVLRSLKVLNKSLEPLGNFEENKQIVRDSVYNSKSGIIVTSGESGIVTVWTEDSKNPISNLKSKTKNQDEVKSCKRGRLNTEDD